MATRNKLMQDAREIGAFAEVVRREGVSSYLEIGSKYGGSLMAVAPALKYGARIVCVDLPNGTKAWPESRGALEWNIAGLKRDGYDAHVIWGDSTAPETVDKVRALGPYDAVFIDGGHTLECVTADWKNYMPLARKLVAFHDIAWRRPRGFKGAVIDVPQLWDRIKGGYRHTEFKFCPTDDCGIGVLWFA